MMMVTTTSHTLQIYGPRDQAWKPALDPIFEAARLAAESGNAISAINLAQDAYIARHGDMHGVHFRISTLERSLAFLGAANPTMLDLAG